MLRRQSKRPSDLAARAMRTAAAGACAIALLALVAAPAALAAGINGNKAFGELATPNSETPTTTATTRNASTSTTTSSSNSRTLILLAGGAAIVLLSAIGYVIVRDARRVAPAADLEAAEARRGRDNAVRQANRRAKSKAARQQRKRNR